MQSRSFGATKSNLARYIQTAPLFDTHEHLQSEEAFVEGPPDILVDLFSNYITADLIVAGADKGAVEHLLDSSDPDIAVRFAGVHKAWERCRLTGYGEAVRIIAREQFGITELTPAVLEAEQFQSAWLRQPGRRLEILEQACIDHVQIDNFSWRCEPDASGPDFFLYDLSWWSFCNGDLIPEQIHKETGVEVKDLESLRESMERIFARNAPCAIAVKSQHAYRRTLSWEERADSDVEPVLAKLLGSGEICEGERLVLGDWCMARGVELAAEHNLPFKIHTGYYAGHSRMPVDRIASGKLWPLLSRYPDTRFILMHIAYPYSEELLAMAKHYPNVWVDLCWAWSINPHACCEFVRSFIHTVPYTKLLGFGGDTNLPFAAAAYARQARGGLARALDLEVEEGELTESDAMMLAERFMQVNQQECFDLDGTRAAIRKAMKAAG
jgi:hypothetical protein